MENQLIKIESELDLAQAVMRAIFNNSTSEKLAPTEDVIKTVQERYDADTESIDRMLEILAKKYGLLEKTTAIVEDSKGEVTSIKIAWSLIFGRGK